MNAAIFEADLQSKLVGMGGVEIRALFDGAAYLAANPDVAASGLDPLLHYHLFGWKEGRDPSLFFETTAYLAANPDVAAAGIDPLEHYLAYGRREGRSATPALLQERGFDAAFYRASNPDVAASGIDPFHHYMTFGNLEGRRPNALFDKAYYLAHNPDVARSGIDALTHYMLFGWREGRDPSAALDTLKYLKSNPDVASAGVNPLVHVLTFGAGEGRVVRPVDEAPSAIVLSSATVDENAAGARIGTLRTADPDGGPFSYTLSDARFEVVDGVLQLRAGQALDHESQPSIRLIVTATDATGLALSTAFDITITDREEAPSFAATRSAAAIVDGTSSAVTGASGLIAFTDPDASDRHNVLVQPVSAASSKLGVFEARVSTPAHDGYGAVEWTYTPDQTLVRALGAGETIQESYQIILSDLGGADSAIHVVTITIKGTNDAPVITGSDVGAVQEDGVLAASGHLAITDDDHGESAFLPGAVTGRYGSLAIDESGAWTYTLLNGSKAVQGLKAGVHDADLLTVTSLDGTQHVITVTVTGADDAAVIAGVDAGTVREDGLLTAAGQLTISDPDEGDSVFLAGSVTGAYGTLSIDSAGHWVYALLNGHAAVQALGAHDHTTDTLTVASRDGTQHGIVVTIDGTNDAPTFGGISTGSVTEDQVLSANGLLTITDVDAGESSFVAGSYNGSYGIVTIDARGAWTYTLTGNALPAVQALNTGETLSDTISVNAIDGTATPIGITINGTREALFSFDNGLVGWTYTGGATVGATGDGAEGTITSSAGKTAAEIEDFLGLSHGSISTAAGTLPSAGHAMKTTLIVEAGQSVVFDWSFTFTDSGPYQDFGMVSVDGTVSLLAKATSASGSYHSISFATAGPHTLGFAAFDTGDNSVNPILRVDHIDLV
ncbi:VCBS domain-containing protein [Methylobacterium durans]|uniref:Cadherin domain-containing protein n=1 Tax=Methylobacterium durans TaxID=2202825 RepID=A0A2U8WE97_9HYPH|nr:VCBS domain-containing protein [Methylobacterium durans]AWN43592.1 hypothetical protein DK389_27665 [Methylobacterium durans]